MNTKANYIKQRLSLRQPLQESLNNLAPADVYFNRGKEILKQREEIKQKTILQRKINHLLQIQNQSLNFV